MARRGDRHQPGAVVGLVLAGLVVSAAAGPVRGQGADRGAAPPGRPSVGLVLSGGGARGLAHIGVLNVLERAGLPIDYVAGTSMGGVVGGLYAAGYPADSLDRLVRHLDWRRILSDTPSRRTLSMAEKVHDGRYIAALPLRDGRVGLPSGLIAGQRISVLLARLTWPVHYARDFRRLPVPFLCLATDIETGEPVELEHGFLPEVIRASMSIPSAFTPVEVDGRLLIDGGVVRNLPARNVRDRGVDFVVCSDVSRPLKERDELTSIIAVMEQTFGFSYWAAVEEQRAYCDLVILPDVDGFSSFSFDGAAALIDRGEEAARALLPEIRSLVERVGGAPAPRLHVPSPGDTVRVHALRVRGLERAPRALVTGQLNLDLPERLTVGRIEEEIDRVYSTRFFERVTYRLEPDSAGAVLEIRVEEKTDAELRLGARYDLRDQSRLLVGTLWRNVLTRGSLLHVDLQVGTRLGLEADYYLKLALARRLGARFRAEATRDRFDVYERGTPVAQLDSRAVSLEAGVGSVFSDRTLYALSLVGEYARTDPRLVGFDYETTRSLLVMPAATFWLDTFDRIDFPTRGHLVYARSQVAPGTLGSNFAFSKHRLLWRSARPVTRRLTVQTGLELAAALGDVPPQHRIALGGVVKTPFETGFFVGLTEDEEPGRYLTRIGVRLQARFGLNQYLTAFANVGTVSDEWHLNPHAHERVLWGLGLSPGLDTPAGPIGAMIGVGNEGRPILTLNVGYVF